MKAVQEERNARSCSTWRSSWRCRWLLLGAAGGAVPQLTTLGNALNVFGEGHLRPRTVARSLKPGYRMAGGLTGSDPGWWTWCGNGSNDEGGSDAGELLGKIQAQGGQLD